MILVHKYTFTTKYTQTQNDLQILSQIMHTDTNLITIMLFTFPVVSIEKLSLLVLHHSTTLELLIAYGVSHIWKTLKPNGSSSLFHYILLQNMN